MTDNLGYYLAFSHFLGIGPIRFKSLLEYFKSPKKAYNSDRESLIKIIGISLTDKFITFRRNFDPQKVLKDMTLKNITFITQIDHRYPELLKNISDPPIGLYVVGNADILNNKTPFFAIVGTRKATNYGLTIAHDFAKKLVFYNITIVSGMALGIDTAAHWGAISGQGKTIAVLGCGVDVVYPRSNLNLYREIIKSGGAIVSEFPPGITVNRGFFIARNRIISGLSSGVLVVEGGIDSGALITARYAADQGRDVFAPPAPITSALSLAPNNLIKDGAKIVLDINDILEEYKIPKTNKESPLNRIAGKLEKEIVTVIMSSPCSADALSRKLNFPVKKILNALSLLEINNIIRKDDEGIFFIREM